MPLNPDVKKQYRALGHNLNPVVTISGNGVSEGVIEEINRALEDHELIKIKLMISDREIRQLAAREVCKKTRSELIQEIGKIALIFRAARQPSPKLSNILRTISS